MVKKIANGQRADFDGFLLNVKEFEKTQKDSEILDSIEKIVKKQNGKFFVGKNR